MVMDGVRLITLDPGHFHAALVQKERIPGVAPLVHVYAPLGPDLIAHLVRIAGFNARTQEPTAWQLEVHAGPEFLDRCFREKPGNVLILSGRNRHKIAYLQRAVEAGLHVLADKPWIIRSEDLTRLTATLDSAQSQGLVAYDIMTERYEITSILQRSLVNDANLFGTIQTSPDHEPGVFMESVHYLMKQVAGVPLRRPAWFFDTTQQGEGLTDVGTHLVDLVQWMLFPEQPLDYRTDVRILGAERWPTVLSQEDFQRVTGEFDFPAFLAGSVTPSGLPYYCNTRVRYALRDVHVTLNVLWGYEAQPGAGDTHLAIFRGSRSRVEVRQGPRQKYRPELYVVPNRSADLSDLLAAVRSRLAQLQGTYPGVTAQATEGEVWVSIPETYRVGHEAHFGEVTRQFLNYLGQPRSLPEWEKPNMLAKYFTTTEGVRLAQTVPPT